MTNSCVADLGEHALIARITSRLPVPAWVVVGPGDDAAVLKPVRNALDVVTTDALVDGVHFDTRFVPPRAIGHRALAVNLSDLAAMGARPRAALLSLALPASLAAGRAWTASWTASWRTPPRSRWPSSAATSRAPPGPWS